MAVAFDAAGGPSYNSINAYTTSWTHTLGASANCIIVAIASTTQGGVNTPTVGGVAMTRLAGPLNFINSFGAQFITLFGLMNPGTGAKTINASVGSFAGYGITGASASYSGVIGFDRAATAGGASNTCSVTVAAPNGSLAVAAMTAVTPTGTTITAFNGTSRVNGVSPAPGGYATFPLLIGDKAGTGQTTLTGTAGGTTYTATGNVAVSLLGDYIPETKPLLTTFSTPGTVTYTIPDWAQKIDVITLGGGGGGQGGGAGFNNGKAGAAGSYGSGLTLTRGIDFPLDKKTFKAFVGAAGPGGSPGNGSAGGRSALSIEFGAVGSGATGFSTYAGQTISYTLGAAGVGGVGGADGGSGGTTTVSFEGITLVATGGGGGKYNSVVANSGGTGTGGSTNATGGVGGATSGDKGGGGGGAIGGVAGSTSTSAGGSGGQSADVSGLQAAVTAASGTWTGVGAGSVAGTSSTPNVNNGGTATGFGSGGGGAGYYGGNGGAGQLGGGGGGAAGYTATCNGGAGGGGAIVFQFTGAATPNVVVSSGSSITIPAGTTAVKIWAVGAGGGGAGVAATDAVSGGGGAAGGVTVSSFTAASGSTIPLSWTHTPTRYDNYVIVSLAASVTGGSYTTHTRTVTYDGAAMTFLGAVNANNGTSGWVESYGIGITPGSDPKTISVTVSKTAAVYSAVKASSVSYGNVNSAGVYAVTSAGSTNVAVSPFPISGEGGNVAVGSMIASSTTVSSVGSYAQRFLHNTTPSFVIVDSGATTDTVDSNVGAALAASSPWGCVSLLLTPLTSVIGAGGAANSITWVDGGRGGSPGNKTFNGQTYVGGTGSLNTGLGAQPAAATAPGAGGGGSGGFLLGLTANGGNGSAGRVWIYAHGDRPAFFPLI